MKFSLRHTIRVAGISALCIFQGAAYLYAAKVTLVAPQSATPDRQAIVVQVFLDTEGEAVSGISGAFSFPQDLFDVHSITLDSSVVSLWVKQPVVSNEVSLDGRTRVSFEGIFPGGFNGVMSAYYQGAKPGFLFSVLLTPKHEGKGAFMVDDLSLNTFSEDAHELAVSEVLVPIMVPTLGKEVASSHEALTRVTSPTLSVSVDRSELISRNAWYISVYEREPKSAIEKLYIAETSVYNPELLSPSEWKLATNPYILLYQKRTKYVHVKIVYADATYAIQTVAPVENSSSVLTLSRILVYIALAGLLFYLYASNYRAHSKKQS